ncbi:MAG: hypothetical protein AAGA46_16205 [Cyanobacteria bacterium P01_F01_bin.13]
MDINLHIDQLVLDGLTLSTRQRRQLQASVETELGRLLTEQGLADYLQADNVIPTLNADAIQVSANPNPARLGTQIAQAIYQGIGP